MSPGNRKATVTIYFITLCWITILSVVTLVCFDVLSDKDVSGLTSFIGTTITSMSVIVGAFFGTNLGEHAAKSGAASSIKDRIASIVAARIESKTPSEPCGGSEGSLATEGPA